MISGWKSYIVPAALYRNPVMNPILAIVYLIVLAWVISRSERKWMTLLWALVAFAATLAAFLILALVISRWAEAFGTLGSFCALLVSALVGFNYIKTTKVRGFAVLN